MLERRAPRPRLRVTGLQPSLRPSLIIGSIIGLVTALLVGITLPTLAQAGKRQSRARPGAVRYHLSIPAPTTRYVHVHLEVSDARGKTTQVAMPAWAPGSYLIRDFGKHVYDVEARSLDGAALPVTRNDKQTWSVSNAGQGFALDYEVFADELSVRTSYVDDRFALLNGTSVFMYVVGETNRAATLELEPPPDWPVHTALARSSTSQLVYTAASYDQLADSPLLLGAAQVREFVVAGKPLEFVLVAPAGTNADIGRLATDTEQVVRSFARTLNGLPFDRYSFLMVADPAGGGGLEHRDSTAMIVDPWVFSRADGYAQVQRLVAHEFFHLWNVKRIHDEVLGPFDYAHETYSELLWFHEGFTETMETRALLRAGLVTPTEYLEQIARTWTGYLRKPGRNHTPIASLSREAWIKAYKPEANHSETTISYYEKGNLIGVCLDLSLRLRGRANHTSGSLDGLFRRLWAQRDPVSGSAAIDINDIVAAASAEAGEDMRWFFDRYVYGTEELPLPALLEQAGFVVELGDADGRDAVWSGVSGSRSVSAIAPGSPAASAGLMHGDEIIAIDGSRVSDVREANERLMDLGVGATASVSLFRGQRLETRSLTTAANPHPRVGCTAPKQAGDLELARVRELWLLEHLETE
ncbi:M61 family metallopeptidase [Enhygromyxa salina]|uniref:M61 glycyl aminopeptidase n=1 Tax=Enhygromyxa salina TaxID=215803 RepID=A0A2S9YAE6_9BACT|nr:PDZ domain-containing protein [Enhygromyxa salina]PRQ01991.1 M61 glycyl aminopeptidase [Enhygromyxa salina]